MSGIDIGEYSGCKVDNTHKNGNLHPCGFIIAAELVICFLAHLTHIIPQLRVVFNHCTVMTSISAAGIPVRLMSPIKNPKWLLSIKSSQKTRRPSVLPSGYARKCQTPAAQEMPGTFWGSYFLNLRSPQLRGYTFLIRSHPGQVLHVIHHIPGHIRDTVRQKIKPRRGRQSAVFATKAL